MTTYEYFLHPVSATQAARIPLPPGLTDAQKEAYAANPPADVIAAAERWPLPAEPAPDVATPDVATLDDEAPGAFLFTPDEG
jgi:hypothetical protein